MQMLPGAWKEELGFTLLFHQLLGKLFRRDGLNWCKSIFLMLPWLLLRTLSLLGTAVGLHWPLCSATDKSCCQLACLWPGCSCLLIPCIGFTREWGKSFHCVGMHCKWATRVFHSGAQLALHREQVRAFPFHSTPSPQNMPCSYGTYPAVIQTRVACGTVPALCLSWPHCRAGRGEGGRRRHQRGRHLLLWCLHGPSVPPGQDPGKDPKPATWLQHLEGRTAPD